MTKYAHVSYLKRFDKTGVHAGGVEKFAEYLRRAIPGMQLFCWTDYPGWLRVKEQDYLKAEILNEHLLKEGLIDSDTVVISDGYWGAGLQGKVARLISVVHGTYFGRMLESKVNMWGEVVPIDHVDMQSWFWKEPSVEVVSVSDCTTGELELLRLDKPITTIRHGVDLEVYRPILDIDRKYNMYAATSNRKGTDVLEYMRVNLNVDLEPMSEFSGRMEKEARRFNEANVVIAPTRHEGNSYLLLDAIACGVPIVTYATGYAMEMDERVGYITDDISPENFRRLMNLVLEKDQEEWIDSVRGFAEEHCDYERFADEWREYVEYDAS